MSTPALPEHNTHGLYKHSFVNYYWVGCLTWGCRSRLRSTTVATMRWVTEDCMVILHLGSRTIARCGYMCIKRKSKTMKALERVWKTVFPRPFKTRLRGSDWLQACTMWQKDDEEFSWTVTGCTRFLLCWHKKRKSFNWKDVLICLVLHHRVTWVNLNLI